MSTVKLQFPEGIGALNVYVTDSEGTVVAEPQLLTPKRNERTFTIDKPGRYTAYWQPLDGDLTTFSFNTGPDDFAATIPLDDPGDVIRELQGARFDRGARAKPRKTTTATASKKRIKAKAAAPVGDAWRQDFESAVRSFAERRSVQSPRPSNLPSPYLTRLKDAATAELELAPLPQDDPKSRTNPQVSIGISSDSTPMRRGGWKPYFAPWPVRLHTSGGLTFVINRDESAGLDPAGLDGARVRFSIGIQGKPLTRFLVPLFGGGVSVNIKSMGPLSQDLTFSILPTNPRARALVQALMSTSSEEARSITDELEVTADQILARLAHNDDYDPWVAVVVGFIIKRYGWPEDCSWSLRLLERFGWIIDTYILAAWWKSTPSGGSDFAASLDYLSKAGRLGAPYLADASATMSDLLVWMASDLENEALRERARQELVKWRQLIQFRGRAGASLSWFATKAHVSRSSDLIAYQGTFSESFFSGSSAS